MSTARGGLIAQGLNDVIRQTALDNDVVVAETAKLIQSGDLVGDCLHPNNSGHADIAAAFADAVTAEVVGPPGQG